MADFGKEGPREQHNYGSGAFIGRDMHGDIRYEMLDPKTKDRAGEAIQGCSRLADLLKRLSVMVSSPRMSSLRFKVRSETSMRMLPWRSGLRGRTSTRMLPSRLEYAGRNINEDVANTILPGRRDPK